MAGLHTWSCFQKRDPLGRPLPKLLLERRGRAPAGGQMAEGTVDGPLRAHQYRQAARFCVPLAGAGISGCPQRVLLRLASRRIQAKFTNKLRKN